MPVVRIANHSPEQQDRWTVAPMAVSEADQLPQHCLASGHVATKAQRLGNHTQLFHVRTPPEGFGETALTDWQPFPGEFPAFESSAWITDDPELLALKINVRKGNKWLWLQCRWHDAEVTQTSAVCKVHHWKLHEDGLHGEMWAKVWSGQDAVDLSGYVGWSDDADPAWRLESVLVSVDAGYWDDNRAPQHAGEPLSLYYGTRNGYSRWDDHRTRIYEGPIPTGIGLPFRGVVMASRNTPNPVTPALSLTERAVRAYEGERKRLNLAAAGGPLTAASPWPQGEWMAFGDYPLVNTWEAVDPAIFRAYLAQPGSIWDERLPYGNDLYHGGAGAQNNQFGAIKGSAAIGGDPWQILELEYSADDYWLRCAHHRTHDGDRITEETHPTWETWACAPETRAAPTWGAKAGTPPNGWDKLPNGRSVLADDQHRGSNALWTYYALTGDELAHACLLDLLACDEMRAKARRTDGRGQYGYDAPRASGRLLQHWAKGVLLSTGEERTRYLRLATHELFICRQVSARYGPGLVRVLNTIRDARVLRDYEAVMWWQEGLAILGLLEFGRACERLGLTDTAQQFLDFAKILAQSLLDYGTGHNRETDQYFVIAGYKWIPGGQPQPPDYYEVPRPGASYETDGDLLIPRSNWWDWCRAALNLATGAKAELIRSREHGSDLNAREWQVAK